MLLKPVSSCSVPSGGIEQLVTRPYARAIHVIENCYYIALSATLSWLFVPFLPLFSWLNNPISLKLFLGLSNHFIIVVYVTSPLCSELVVANRIRQLYFLFNIVCLLIQEEFHTMYFELIHSFPKFVALSHISPTAPNLLPPPFFCSNWPWTHCVDQVDLWLTIAGPNDHPHLASLKTNLLGPFCAAFGYRSIHWSMVHLLEVKSLKLISFLGSHNFFNRYFFNIVYCGRHNFFNRFF